MTHAQCGDLPGGRGKRALATEIGSDINLVRAQGSLESTLQLHMLPT